MILSSTDSLTTRLQRRLPSHLRSLATAASPSSTISRPRLDALRAQPLPLDHFLAEPARRVFTKSKQCVSLLSSQKRDPILNDGADRDCLRTSRQKYPSLRLTTRSRRISGDSVCTPCVRKRGVPTSGSVGEVTRETLRLRSWYVPLSLLRYN